MNFTPTAEQEIILQHVRDTNDNLLISALAGAAKTTTLVLIAEALDKSTLCLAFNKRIATEMQERLPSQCVASTLNSLGHRAWAQILGRRLILDDRKTFRLLKARYETLEPDEARSITDSFLDLLHVIEDGKAGGYVPDDLFPQAKPLLTDDDIASGEIVLSELEFQIVRDVSAASIREALTGTIDYDDQLLMPTCFPCSFPHFPVVMVDEAQDLSELNHAMLRKIVKRARLIAVGDECQSIYGFRGAHSQSMELLRQTFSMTPLVLSVSFRCPISVVNEARWRAPHMQWPSWAKEGKVQNITKWRAEELPAGAVILCRNNAPLFRMAIALLKRGRYPELVGNDLAKSLIGAMKKLGPLSTPREQVLVLIDKWADKRKQKVRRKNAVDDQAACMKVFAWEGANLGQAITYAEATLARSGPIKLMTIHKAKGLEFDDVFILDSFLIGEDQQDQNLKYVGQTRAKSTLTYITSEGLQDE